MSLTFNEDLVFVKVKRALLVAGAGGLKQAVRAFRSAQDSNAEITADGFAKLLAALGTPLSGGPARRAVGIDRVSGFDLNFLCLAFRKDSKNDKSPIDVNIVVRELCGGINQRRLTAIAKAYRLLSNDGTSAVSADMLMQTHRGSAFASTVRTVSETAVSTQLDQAFTGDEAVTWEEFLAYYAGVSAGIPLDHTFEVAVLRTWNGSDASAQPRMGETDRVWGPAGDSLAIQHDGLVKEALSPSHLRIEKIKLYDYTHGQRRSVAPLYLPSVVPDYITTTARSFPEYTSVDMRKSNPLLVRTLGRVAN